MRLSSLAHHLLYQTRTSCTLSSIRIYHLICNVENRMTCAKFDRSTSQLSQSSAMRLSRHSCAIHLLWTSLVAVFRAGTRRTLVSQTESLRD